MGDIDKNKESANSKSLENYKKQVQNNYKENQYNKRQIKDNPSDKKYTTSKGMGGKILLLALAGALVMRGVEIYNEYKEEIKQIEWTNQNQSTRKAIKLKENRVENRIKEAEEDFLKRYLDEYNKIQNTEYMVEDVSILAEYNESGNVYSVNDKIITPGKDEEMTRKKLSKFGEVEIISGYDRILQIVYKDEYGKKEILSTINADRLDSIYSGLQIEDLENGKKLVELEYIVTLNEEMIRTIIDIEYGKDNENLNYLEEKVNKYNELKIEKDNKNRRTLEKEDIENELGN